VVDEKPEVRCHNNHPELYRDLERVGIDGWSYSGWIRESQPVLTKVGAGSFLLYI
jgi:hypothetical protein